MREVQGHVLVGGNSKPRSALLCTNSRVCGMSAHFAGLPTRNAIVCACAPSWAPRISSTKSSVWWAW